MSNKKQTWASSHSQLWTSGAARSAGSRTQSEVSSIASPNRDRSLLDDSTDYSHANDVSALNGSQLTSARSKEKTLVQVSDILESYGTISRESDIPAVLLSVIKDLERAKQENNFKDLLLREYGDAVRRRFGLYGEAAPPSVVDLSKRLREGAVARPAAAPSPVWLEEQLSDLRCAVQSASKTCFGEDVNFSLPLLLPDAAHTKANVSHVLQRCRDDLVRLSTEYKDAKDILMARLRLVPTPKSSSDKLSLAEALAELDSQQALNIDGVARGSSADGEKGHTLKTALQSIVDTVPASLQIHFELQRQDAPVLSQCGNLAQLLRFLLSEYLSMERYMEEVNGQRLKLAEVFRLPSSEFGAEEIDSGTQIEDALSRSLEALKKTVTAVVTFPHHISEEEIALRRSSMEAVEELAQLLVESRHTASSSSTSTSHSVGPAPSGARIEPPTRDLSEMVGMVKSRFATLFAQQQRKELAGAQGRAGLAHMEDSMKNYGKQVMQQLRELCTMQDGGVSADQSEALSELMGSVDVERNLSPAKLDFFLSDVAERLRVLKTKHQRALNAAASNKIRADAAAQKCAAAHKKLHKIAACVERLGKEGLRVTFPPQLGNTADVDDLAPRGGAATGSDGGRGDGVSALRRLNLRPSLDASPHKSAGVAGAAGGGALSASAAGAGPAVTESNVLEALQFLATRVCADDALRDQVQMQDELEKLRDSQARWKADTTAFHEAMAMLMHRLASNGQLVKQSLFMMGTDEAAKDDVVEEVLQRGEGKADDEAEVEYVERSLAELLQKYTRWAQRLQQTTEDHLYTQRKIVKYFAAVRRFFTSQQGKDVAPPEDIPDDNLYDIDSCLMRAADVILPALDAAIQGVEGQRDAHSKDGHTSAAAASAVYSAPAPAAAKVEGQAEQRQEALTQLVKDSAAAAAGGVLPYDHRIARLYETVARLYTAVSSLMQVHYLSIPTAVRRRSSGDVELVFEGDAEEDGFVDIDLDRLIRVSQRRSGRNSGDDGDGAEAERFSRDGAKDGQRGPASPPPSTIAANNDVILRVTYQNMEVLQDTLKRFSANHKMAAIVLRKDVDAMQQQLAAMLEKYSEVDMEAAFNQSRDELHGLYVTLRDRAQVQKGCYFFNRVGGEGSCTWVTALDRLGEGFSGVVDRLVQRTTQAAAYREVVDGVVDTCAMYMNWAEHHSLPSTLTLPPDLLECCVRDDKKAAVVTAAVVNDSPAQTPPAAGSAAAGASQQPQRPPKPSSMPSLTPRDSIKQQQQEASQESREAMAAVDAATADGDAVAEPKVSCFTEDRVTLRVMEHMFQLAQYNAENTAASASAADVSAVQEAEARAQQVAEEMSLLREAATVAEHHIDELTTAKQAAERQRDQAQSEAAVARAELRRWKRLHQHHHDAADPPTPQRGGRDAEHPKALGGGVSLGSVPPPSSPPDTRAGPTMDEATVREVVSYMKVLSEELQAAKQRAGAGLSPRRDSQHQRRQQQQPGEEGEGEEERESEELVRSPYSAGLDARGVAASYEHFNDDRQTHSAPPLNRYSALADELRHRYGAAALAPLVVVDPQPHYSVHRGSHTSAQAGGTAGRRYSPVKFHGPAYDACERYYGRELTDGEGEQGAERLQRRGGGGGVSAGGVPPSASPPHTRTPQRRPPRRAKHGEEKVHHEAFFDDSAVQRKASLTAAATTPQRYPRSLTRDEPLRGVAAGSQVGPLTPTPRTYQTPQRATPVASATTAHGASLSTTTSRRRSSAAQPPLTAAPAASRDHDGAVYERYTDDDDETDGAAEDVFYDDVQWRAASHGGRSRPSAPPARQSASSFPSTRSTSLGASSTTNPSFGGRPGLASSDHDGATNLVEAVRQIEAAATHSTRPTPTRRGSQADRRRASAPTPPTPEQQMSRNVNLRSTALRRLAEVVSRTKVTPPRGARF